MSKKEVIFQEVLAGVKKLKNKEKIIKNSPCKSRSQRERGPEGRVRENACYISEPHSCSYSPEEKIEYFAKDVTLDPKIVKKIKNGEYPISAKVDLHGETQESAGYLLFDFLEKAKETQARCLLIIHGKGREAKLKNLVCHGLKQITEVLFFCSAQPKDGGAGALYVFLKRVDSKKNANDALNELRKNIDHIDEKIVKLLCERFSYAKEAAILKKSTAKDSSRERAIIQQVGLWARMQGYPEDAVKAIFAEILSQMRKYQNFSK